MHAKAIYDALTQGGSNSAKGWIEPGPTPANHTMDGVRPGLHVGLYRWLTPELFCVGTRGYGVPGNENDESIVCMSVLY